MIIEYDVEFTCPSCDPNVDVVEIVEMPFKEEEDRDKFVTAFKENSDFFTDLVEVSEAYNARTETPTPAPSASPTFLSISFVSFFTMATMLHHFLFV